MVRLLEDSGCIVKIEFVGDTIEEAAKINGLSPEGLGKSQIDAAVAISKASTLRDEIIEGVHTRVTRVFICG
jgi:hypothetical protein